MSKVTIEIQYFLPWEMIKRQSEKDLVHGFVIRLYNRLLHDKRVAKIKYYRRVEAVYPVLIIDDYVIDTSNQTDLTEHLFELLVSDIIEQKLNGGM